VPFVLQLNASVCVCVQPDSSTDRQTDTMIRRVLRKIARFLDRGDYALFVVVTPTCITVSW
jgi:hypothetical protein